VQRVGIIAQCDAGVGFEEVDVNPLVEIDDVFALGVDFDEYFVLAHLFDDFADVGAGFLEVVEFFAEHSDFGVCFVAAGFEALEVGCSFLDC